MPRVQGPTRKRDPGVQPKTDWVLIEGSGKTVLKTIGGILERTGDNNFQVEFRIYRSSREATPSPESSKPKPPKRKRRRGIGSLTTIFVPRRKRKR